MTNDSTSRRNTARVVKLKILDVEESDVDERGNYLLLEATEKFIGGNYTHLRCDGCTTDVKVVHSQGFYAVLIGVDVTGEI